MQHTKIWTWMLVAIVMLSGLAMPIRTAAFPAQNPAEPAQMTAGPLANSQSTIRNQQSFGSAQDRSAIQDSGVYTETFATYTAKHYTDNAEWDIWTHALRLVARTSGSASRWSPAMAVEPTSGNAVVVWEDYRNGNGDIYAQRVDARGNRLWAADVRVNSDSGTASQGSPVVAVDPASGNALVVWADGRNSSTYYFDIYAQRIDASGNKLWAADVRVNSYAGTASQFSPAVAVDPASGNAIVVWQAGDIYAQRLDAGGNKLWAADVRVNSDAGTASQYYPVVAVDPASGNAIVEWED